MLTFLLRGSLVTLKVPTWTKIPSDMPATAPHYFLNVPQLLERMRRGVDEQIAQNGGVAQAIYSRAKPAWIRQEQKQSQSLDFMWLCCPRLLSSPRFAEKDGWPQI